MPSIQDTGAPYPEAPEGHLRYVISLPSYEEELEQEHLQVQIIVVRYESGDDGNRYVYRGSLHENTVEGWGYPYWVAELQDLVATRSTPTAQHKDNYIPLIDAPLTRYNSKLPIVVYCPDGCEVHYRVWSDETGRRLQADQPAHASRAVAAPVAAPAEDQYQEYPDAAQYPTEDADAPLGGDDQYPTEAAAPEHQPQAYSAVEGAEQAYPAPENDYSAHSRGVVPLSATERGGSADQLPTYPEQAQEAVEGYQARAQEGYEHLQTEREQYVRDAEERASELRAREQQAGEDVQDRVDSARKSAKESKKKAKARASQLQEDALEAQRSAPVMPLSSTEVSPSKVKSNRGSIVSPKRSSAADRDLDISGSEATPSKKKDKSSKTKRNSTTKRDSSVNSTANSENVSPSKKKRGGILSPRKSKGTDDKYREL